MSGASDQIWKILENEAVTMNNHAWGVGNLTFAGTFLLAAGEAGHGTASY